MFQEWVMTLAESLQIKHFQLRAGPELKANSCASHSFSSTYSQPLSCSAFLFSSYLSWWLPSFLSCIFIPSLFLPSFPLFFPFVFQKQWRCIQCWLLVCGLVLKKESKSKFFLSFFLFLFLSPCCLMGGTPPPYQTLTASSNIMAGLNWKLCSWVCDCIWDILCCSCSKISSTMKKQQMSF